MVILVYFSNFTDEDIAGIRKIAADNGGHEVVVAADEGEAVNLAADAEVILGLFPEPVTAAAAKLRWIQSFSAGMDKFLYPAIIERNDVAISNVAGLYASQGGEHAWALLLALTRQIPLAVHNKERRAWQGEAVIEIRGGTLGLIGLGGFGMEMAKRAQGYDMTLVAIDPVRTDKPDLVDELKPANRDNLFSLLQRSDVVMLACPLTPETYHLIGAEELKVMKPSAYLINVTRGGIVDEPALVEALAAGEIAGAALDVVEKEPLAADSPLWDAPNLILTPHRAGASQHRPRMIVEFFAENLTRYLQGEQPHNIIDKQRGF